MLCIWYFVSDHLLVISILKKELCKEYFQLRSQQSFGRAVNLDAH